MHTAHSRLLKVTGFGVLIAVIVAGCTQETEPTGDAAGLVEALQQRTDVMQELVSEANVMVQELEGLSERQWNAVAGLIAVSKPIAIYESSHLGRQEDVLRDFYGRLVGISRGFVGAVKFQPVMACFDQSVSCLSALQKCRAEAEEGNRNADECDSDPKVVGPCADEALCMLRQFEMLRGAIPDILGGRDPWPPQPFPYDTVLR